MEFKSQKIYIIIGAAVIVFIASCLAVSNNFWNLDHKKINIVQETSAEKVMLTIDNGDGNSKNFTANFIEGITAFDLLKNETDNSGLNLKTKAYDIGIMIEAIGDKENGQGGKYWLYYVNGVMPMVSADKEEIKAGDKVEFKFEKSPF